MDKEKHCWWDHLSWLKEHNDSKYPFYFIKGKSNENNHSRNKTQMNKIMNNLQTQKYCLCFSKWVIVRSRAAVYFHCIQLLTPNHALTCCWKYDLLACLTGGLRLFVAWRRHWVEPNWKNVSRLGLWWQDNSCLIQGNELNETLALCFSALTVNWLGIYLPWQVGNP